MQILILLVVLGCFLHGIPLQRERLSFQNDTSLLFTRHSRFIRTFKDTDCAEFGLEAIFSFMDSQRYMPWRVHSLPSLYGSGVLAEIPRRSVDILYEV